MSKYLDTPKWIHETIIRLEKQKIYPVTRTLFQLTFRIEVIIFLSWLLITFTREGSKCWFLIHDYIKEEDGYKNMWMS